MAPPLRAGHGAMMLGCTRAQPELAPQGMDELMGKACLLLL